MLNGDCVIVFLEGEQRFISDDEKNIVVFPNEPVAQKYADEEGLKNYIIVGLLNKGGVKCKD
jgi:hypothetical protein